MTNQISVLKKLVALKRQRAEQHMLSLQQELERIQVSLIGLSSRLQSIHDTSHDFLLFKLANGQGHVTKIIADIAAQQRALTQAELNLGFARGALKSVLFSEERLLNTIED